MRAAILATGTELTRGELVNGNAAWLSERLTALGIDVIEHAVVADDAARIGATLARFGRDVKLVVCTGGLGPTSDDLTAQAVADLLELPLLQHPASLERIRARFRKFGRPMPEINAKQADFPRGARVLDNDQGTAPGFAIEIGQALCYFFPGVPSEMQHLFERYLAPEIAPKVERSRCQLHIRTFGLGESNVAERLADIDLGGPLHKPGVLIGYRAHFPEIEVKVLAQANDEARAQAMAAEVAEQVRERLAPFAYGGREDSFPAYVGGLLRARALKLALAESCTGGLIGKLLTDVPGSSDYLLLDAVTYANSAKRDVLGVDAELLEHYGAVSAEVAEAMAEGALRRAGADLAVAVTGVAGPGGGSEQKPVGTLWLALARRDGKTLSERRQAWGDRERVRTLAAYMAMQLVARAADTWSDASGARGVLP